MNNRRVLVRLVTIISLVLTLGASGCVEASLLGLGGDSWKEEVLLHDGSKMIVERTVERGGRHEIGQRPPYKEQSLSFSLPGTDRTIKWEDHYSQDLGQANFLPMALDISSGTPYLVAYPMGCLSYNKWERPTALCGFPVPRQRVDAHQARSIAGGNQNAQLDFFHARHKGRRIRQAVYYGRNDQGID